MEGGTSTTSAHKPPAGLPGCWEHRCTCGEPGLFQKASMEVQGQCRASCTLLRRPPPPSISEGTAAPQLLFLPLALCSRGSRGSPASPLSLPPHGPRACAPALPSADMPSLDFCARLPTRLCSDAALRGALLTLPSEAASRRAPGSPGLSFPLMCELQDHHPTCHSQNTTCTTAGAQGMVAQ